MSDSFSKSSPYFQSPKPDEFDREANRDAIIDRERSVSRRESPITSSAILVSALLPCLNEERTIGLCIKKVQRAFARLGISGEVIVGDNGSTDRSIKIAEEMGARVIHQPVRGYGAAIQAAAKSARGKYLIMADADDSYDWSDIDGFITELEDGADLVMGNRFGGGIEPGAMPALHRYLGNPLLSAAGRILHNSPIRDFHCGMRGFTSSAFEKMGARSPGMEFASEMVVNARRAKLDVREVPIKLYPDKRGREPHLRSFRDGWRHLRLLIAYAPDIVYLAPGIIMLVLGAVGLVALSGGPIEVNGLYFGTHFVALATMSSLIGLTAILLGALAKVAIAIYHPVESGRAARWLDRNRAVEWLVFSGGSLAALGLIADALIAFRWIFDGGSMESSVHLSFAVTTICVSGVMMFLTGFVLKLLLDNLQLDPGL